MELAANPAPALSRGLDLLRRLTQSGPASLESLTRATDWPKSSVSRILQSLELAGAVRRDPMTRMYHPELQLVPVETAGRSLIDRAAGVMDALCRETGVTVELYAARDAGLTMIDRREPDQAEVCVRARVGHRRDLTEIEALSQVARTWRLSAKPDPIPLPTRSLWTWEAGQKTKLTASNLKSTLEQTRQRQIGIDLDINENGVRRYACTIAPTTTTPTEYEGILAVAQVCPPTALEPDPRLIASLKRAADRLLHT
ncbi:MAG: helix-turn-helix domain-containing protein [Planctomycetota bacterium]